jgi:hypothetical protein
MKDDAHPIQIVQLLVSRSQQNPSTTLIHNALSVRRSIGDMTPCLQRHLNYILFPKRVDVITVKFRSYKYSAFEQMKYCIYDLSLHTIIIVVINQSRHIFRSNVRVWQATS